MNNKIYVPTKGPESWREFLADHNKQWKPGHSAKTMAHSWEENNGFPPEIEEALVYSGLNLEILLAIPEYKVYLDTVKAPSQNDLFVLAKDTDELVVLMIEGKVSESFDKLIKSWYNSDSKLNRFNFLAKKLELEINITDSYDFRYQLFHRTVSSILVAEKFNAKKAILLVHSFSQTDKWFKDYESFVNLISLEANPKVNQIFKCKKLNTGIDLYVGWVKGNEEYLKK